TTPINNLFCRIAGPRRATDVAMTQVGMSLYRGESEPLPRGKYNAVLMVKAGDLERVLMRQEVAVPGSQAPDAAELRIRPANVTLLRELAQRTGGAFDAPVAEILRHHGATVTNYRSINDLLLPLVIVLLLGEVFIRRRFLGD
ncbi:MAG: hypothetical protein ACREQN_10800, partial [Candidatus Binataceae bacterium]